MILKSYATAKEIYASIGVDTDEVLKKMDEIRISNTPVSERLAP